MAVYYALHVALLAVVALPLGNAGTGVEQLVEDSLDLRVEPLVGHNNTSLLSGIFVVNCPYMCRLDQV